MQLASSIISQFSLLEARGLNRPTLDMWAGRTLQRLSELFEQRPFDWTSIGDNLNRAALIELYRGEPGGARSICEFQLRWAARLSCQHGHQAAAALAIQPWINIGRLLRIERKFDQSLDHFKLFLAQASNHPLRLGPVKIEQDVWQAFESTTPGMNHVLEAVYVLDSLKTYFAARDYGGALDFVQRCRADSHIVRPLHLEEGELVAQAGLANHADALEVSLRPEWTQSPLGRLLSALYRGSLLLLLDERERARHFLNAVAERVFQSRPESLRNQQLLRILHLLGACTAQAGLESVASRIFQLGLQAARAFDDEPLTLSFLDACLSLEDPPEARAALEQEREQLLRCSLYFPILRARGAPVTAPTAPAPVFEALRQAIFKLGEA